MSAYAGERPDDLRAFWDALRAEGDVRAMRRSLDACWQAWRAVERAGFGGPAAAFPREALAALLERGAAQGLWTLPARSGDGWDTSARPALPRRIALPRAPSAPADGSWRDERWPAALEWVPAARALRPDQVTLLRGLRTLLACDAFAVPETLHFRSLQVTGDEKRLAPLIEPGGWLGPARIPPATWNLVPTPLALPWTRVGSARTGLIVENVGPYRLLQRVLPADGPVGVLVCGHGNGIADGIAGLGECGGVRVFWYLGDLDVEGRAIARRAQGGAARAGVAPVRPLPGGVSAMLAGAARLRAPNGWAAGGTPPGPDAVAEAVAELEADVQADVARVLRAGCRIPEEVLDSRAWAALLRDLR